MPEFNALFGGLRFVPQARTASPQLRRGLVWGGVAVALLALVALFIWRRDSAATPQYVTATVTRGTVAPAVISSGTVNPVTTVQVGSYVSGVIQSILCDFNTQVQAGQLCARIDPRPYQTAVEQEVAALGTAHAQLLKDRANLDYAKAVSARNTDLLQRGMVSQEAADAATNAYAQARAQLAIDAANVAQHEAQLKAARINLGYTDIVSPVSGTVVSRNVTQGQTVAASFQTPTLFLIATDLAKMQVDTNVSESDIGRIAAGDGAVFTVTAYPERQFKGEVQQVRQAPQTVQNVVTYDVVVAVPNADLALKPGMTASMRIVTSRADQVLRVPDQALRYRPAASPGEPAAAARRDSSAGAHVWVLSDGALRSVPVTVGLDDDTYAEITAGELREGDVVVVSERAAAASRSATSPISLIPARR